jgi:predicted metal-dependent HD superfamily phosphohydrolase
MNDITGLKAKWHQCWQDPAVNRDAVNRVFELLVAAYTKPDRYYHNLTHIHQVLTTIERFTVGDSNQFLAPVKNPNAVLLAAWFHDFVYDSRSEDNEIQSAKAAAELITTIGGSIELIDRVHTLILATQGHQLTTDDPDRSLLLDADLAILGADPVQYQVYQQSIRREYSWVPDAVYQAGRIQVLENFLQRTCSHGQQEFRLYDRQVLFDELDSMARLNMRHEIELLNLAIPLS